MERPQGLRQVRRERRRDRRQDNRQDRRDRERQQRAIRNGSREVGAPSGAPSSPSLTGISTSSPSSSGGSGGGGGGTGGGGGGSATVPPLDLGPTIRPSTPFGDQYAFSEWDMLRRNPEALADEWMRMNGIDPLAPGGGAASIMELAPYIPLLHVLSQTGTAGLSTTGDAALLDFAKLFLDQAMAPGADAPNLGQNLFAAGPESGLYKAINNPALDAAGQANEFLRYLGAALAMVDSGPVADSIYQAALLQANRYISQQAKTPQSGQSFADLLRGTDLDEYLNS